MRHNEARDQRSAGRGIVASRQRQRWRMQPTLLVLEDKRLLSTIVVNNPTDTPKTGQTDLRQAIALANTNGGTETITFDKTVFKTPQTINLTGGQLELSDTTGTVTITGPKAGVTASAGGLSRVFEVDANVTASISGMTITGGNVGYAGYGASGGGGLANFGTTTLTGCTITGNTSYTGGGLYNGGTTTLNGCVISDNSTSSYFGQGGGMLNRGAATLDDCTVSGNTARFGGGLYAADFFATGSTTLTGCTISNNTANGVGGGAFLLGKSNLTDCTVTDNSSTGFWTWDRLPGGGGLALGGSSTLTDCTVNGNTSYIQGGGVSLAGGGGMTMAGCTISGNKAGVNPLGNSIPLMFDSGGGVSLTYSASATLTDCTISGNNASGNGGGLSSNFGSTTSLIKCSVSGNSAVNGGGGCATSGGGVRPRHEATAARRR